MIRVRYEVVNGTNLKSKPVVVDGGILFALIDLQNRNYKIFKVSDPTTALVTGEGKNESELKKLTKKSFSDLGANFDREVRPRVHVLAGQELT